MRQIILCISILFLLTGFKTLAQDNFSVITKVVDGYPMLSPDGRKIVFTSNRTGTYQIYLCDSDGSNIVQLTNSIGSNASPVWSPDGSKIVFASERDNDSEIYIMNTNGTEQKRLTDQPGDDSHPKFSPDGKRIIFNSPRTSPDLSISWTSQFIEVFTMDIEGNDLKQITFLKSVCTYPSFSPDGSKIVFRQLIKDSGLNWSLDSINFNSEVYVMNSDGSNPMNISNSKAFDGWPFWMPDSKTIVFTSNRGQIENMGQLYSVNPDGSNLNRLTDTNNSFIQASVSKDGKTILAQRNWETETYEYGHIVTIKIE
ncbi:MAG: hypothetical protein DRI75_13045 [Bacteroidetes bacterium]|nr:MAG: hypothetical protein DRI75_13045 [Bacteroidota bacterium]